MGGAQQGETQEFITHYFPSVPCCNKKNLSSFLPSYLDLPTYATKPVCISRINGQQEENCYYYYNDK